MGIDFLSTPFDNTAVDFLEDMGLEFYKIASFEMIDLPLVEYVASKGKPIIMSTGMATLEEIREAVETVYHTGNRQLVLLKCSSAYPADPAQMYADDYRYAETFRPAHWSVGSFHGFHECCDGGGPGGIGY